MKTEILTPDALIFEGNADVVTLPGVVGSFQILEGHAPMVSVLQRGTITVKSKGEEHNYLATGGVVEVINGKVSVLAESIVS
jgi:F-type H+-transporting ATPase subunit epsilon